MNCPKCGTVAQAGAPHCKRCGAALTAKAAAPSSSDEIDLMPLEPSKAPAFSQFEPPPDMGPPPAPGTKVKTKQPFDPDNPPPPDNKIRGAMAIPKKSNLNAIIGGAVGLLLVLWIAWSFLRTKDEVVVGKAKQEPAVTLQGGQTRVENISVTGLVPYSLEISVTEGEMLVGVVQRSHKDPANLAALKKLSDPLETVKKGETRTLTGEFKHKEQYSWVVGNDTKKPARAKVKFLAQAP